MQKGRDNTICMTVALLSTFVAWGCRKAEQSQKGEGVVSPAEKLVTFDVPKEWVLQKHLIGTNLETFQFLISDTATEGITSDSANAGISIEKIQDGLGFNKFCELTIAIDSETRKALRGANKCFRQR